MSYPLLKYAACAYAAKHLSRTRDKSDYAHSPVHNSHVPTTSTWPNAYEVDWDWYGAKYYAQAIKLLRETLPAPGDLDQASRQTSPGIGGGRLEQSTIHARISDETLAAMAILCNFEFMSASDVEWTRHLNGTLLVSDLRQAGVISLMSSPQSKARKAIFWNLFRQDVYAACMFPTRTAFTPSPS